MESDTNKSPDKPELIITDLDIVIQTSSLDHLIVLRRGMETHVAPLFNIDSILKKLDNAIKTAKDRIKAVEERTN